jgi:hypothetical protein
MNINLRIERLILDGLPVEARHRAALQAEIELELARLLTESDVAANWQSGGAIPSAPAAIQISAQNSPAEIGRQIAGSIYGGIGKVV